MKICGREPRFAYTVGAERQLTELRAKRNADGLRDLLSGSRAERTDNMIALVQILSEWGERLAAAEDPSHEPQPLQRDELELLPMADFVSLFDEAMNAISRDSGRTVETAAPDPQKKTGTGSAASS